MNWIYVGLLAVVGWILYKQRETTFTDIESPLYNYEENPSILDTVKDWFSEVTTLYISPAVTKLAEAIQAHEGWYVGSRAYRNNNPGNLRPVPGRTYTGQIAIDGGNYIVFDSFEHGWQALTKNLARIVAGTSALYNSEARKRDKADSSFLTLREFFSIYAPSSDFNNPDRYAQNVAARLEVSAWTTLREL